MVFNGDIVLDSLYSLLSFLPCFFSVLFQHQRFIFKVFYYQLLDRASARLGPGKSGQSLGGFSQGIFVGVLEMTAEGLAVSWSLSSWATKDLASVTSLYINR